MFKILSKCFSIQIVQSAIQKSSAQNLDGQILGGKFKVS